MNDPVLNSTGTRYAQPAVRAHSKLRMFAIFFTSCLFSILPVLHAVDFVFPASFSATNEQMVLSIDEDEHQLQPLDAAAHLSPQCHMFSSDDACEDAIDKMFHIVNGKCDYAPRLVSRTVEDLQTCRDDILRILVDRYQYKWYLEIGCFQDEVFNRIQPLMDVAVGVDPKTGGTVRSSSDDFFRSNTETFDIIFIDGDHSAQQAHVDVQNALEVLRPGGSIVMHDCNPRLEKRQIRNGNPGGAYNGDVWKVAVYLRSRPDLEIVVIDVDHGVGVVRRRPNLHPLPDHLAEKLRLSATEPLKAFAYQDLNAHREELLRLVTVQGFRQWLDDEVAVDVSQSNIS
jgi:SAM-dependent methyltransferase